MKFLGKFLGSNKDFISDIKKNTKLLLELRLINKGVQIKI